MNTREFATEIIPGTFEYFDMYSLHDKGNAGYCFGCIDEKPLVCEKCGGIKHHHLRGDEGEPYQNYHEYYCEGCGDTGEFDD